VSRDHLPALPFPSQLSMVAARARAIYDRQARERMQIRKGDQPGASPVNLPDLIKGASDARDAAGKAVGVFANFGENQKVLIFREAYPFPALSGEDHGDPIRTRFTIKRTRFTENQDFVCSPILASGLNSSGLPRIRTLWLFPNREKTPSADARLRITT